MTTGTSSKQAGGQRSKSIEDIGACSYTVWLVFLSLSLLWHGNWTLFPLIRPTKSTDSRTHNPTGRENRCNGPETRYLCCCICRVSVYREYWLRCASITSGARLIGYKAAVAATATTWLNARPHFSLSLSYFCQFHFHLQLFRWWNPRQLFYIPFFPPLPRRKINKNRFANCRRHRRRRFFPSRNLSRESRVCLRKSDIDLSNWISRRMNPTTNDEGISAPHRIESSSSSSSSSILGLLSCAILRDCFNDLEQNVKMPSNFYAMVAVGVWDWLHSS